MEFEHLMSDNFGQYSKIENLMSLSAKEREFAIFHLFYEELNEKDKMLLKEATRKHPFTIGNLYPIMEKGNAAKLSKLCTKYNRTEIFSEPIEKYKLLLEKMSVLARELNLNSSLELSILFSYLLWNGYLSKEKKYKFQSKNRKFIMGLFFEDIIEGIGVCLNHSEMLKDFLNHCGYSSCIIPNHLDDYIKVDYKLNIKRPGVSKGSKLISLVDLFKKAKANHTFNLIEENNKIYIYDSTNFLLYNIVDEDNSKLVNGKGKNKLYPYQSYNFCISSEDDALIDRLITSSDYQSPYTKSDFISISDVNLEIIKNSITLLEDFYIEAKKDMIDISETTNKIIKKKKK